MSERIGGWIQTRTGVAFYPNDPRPSEVNIEDIAHALSNICRFAGHVKRFYSVAEHSYWVSTIVPPQFALAGLMHDAPEAYVVDLPKPLKDMLPSYKAVEHWVWDAICDHFGMPLELPDAVHQADVEMLLAEKDQLLGPAPQDWSPFFQCFKPANVGELPCWSPREAKRMFLERFVTLTQGGAA